MTNPPIIPNQTVAIAGEPGQDPLIVTASVISVVSQEAHGVYGRIVGLDARLHVTFAGRAEPHVYHLSRLVGEEFWAQDAHFRPGSYPHFVHGFGSRTVQVRYTPVELEALLDQAAITLGLAEQIGPDTPLVLAAATQPATAPAVVHGQAGA